MASVFLGARRVLLLRRFSCCVCGAGRPWKGFCVVSRKGVGHETASGSVDMFVAAGGSSVSSVRNRSLVG